MINFFILLLAVMTLWSGLVFPLSAQEAITGLGISLMVSLAVSPFLKGKESFKLSRIGSFVLFFFIFLRELVKANLDMARIVLSPSLPISPKIVKVKTGIRSKVGKAFLANAITLTPGTLSVELEGDEIYIHVVDGDAVANESDITKPFEKVLEGAFDR